MIFKGLKKNSIRRTIKRELSKSFDFKGKEDVVRSLAIIINYDKLVDYKPLLNVAKAINISYENVFILGYVNKIYRNVSYLIPVFSDNSIGMNGKIKNEALGDFLNREYDIVINYYTEPNIYLELVSVLSKSNLKVGISEQSEAINNLVLKINEENFSQFSNELVKYLSILKKI